jgi:LacI family transcriptional regulator
MARRQKRILLAFGWYDYRLHRGIEKYAQERGWHLCPDTTKEKVVPWGWEGDGILAWLGTGDDLADFVVQARQPTVDFSFRRPHLRFARVLVDHASVAQLAADHFLAHGHRHFAYYSDVNNWAFEENGQAFMAAVQAAGHECTWLCWHRSPAFNDGRLQWKHKRDWLAAQLKQAAKPLAVFTATDDHAVEVLESCETAHLKVPEQISIVGVNNSLLAVDAMRTPISSVDTNLELVGYRGAELLDALMRGARPRPEPVRIPPAGLIARKSSDLLAVAHPGVARALRFMTDHGHENIGVNEIARFAGISRRGLHQAFLKQLGRPPGQELRRMRLERAKLQLVESAERLPREVFPPQPRTRQILAPDPAGPDTRLRPDTFSNALCRKSGVCPPPAVVSSDRTKLKHAPQEPPTVDRCAVAKPVRATFGATPRIHTHHPVNP